MKDSELFTGPLCRCPVEGCPFSLDTTGRSQESARSVFFSHLEWHEQQGLKPGESGTVAPSAVAPSRPAYVVPESLSEAVARASYGEPIDWAKWHQEVELAVGRLPPLIAQAVAAVIVAAVRSLEDVEW